MRRFITCVLWAFIATVVGAGPVGAGTKIELGPKLGLNFATMTGEEFEPSSPNASTSFNYIPGGIVGGFVTIRWDGRWAIQPEVLFSQKGTEWEDVTVRNDTTSTRTTQIEVDYVEIPVLVKFTIPRTGRFEPFFYAGPAIAFKTVSSLQYEAIVDRAGTKISHYDNYSSCIYNAKSVIIEGTIGIGVDWKLGSNRLTVEGRYTRSYKAVFEDVDDFDAIPEDDTFVARYPSGEAYELNHSVFSIIVGFGFSL